MEEKRRPLKKLKRKQRQTRPSLLIKHRPRKEQLRNLLQKTTSAKKKTSTKKRPLKPLKEL